MKTLSRQTELYKRIHTKFETQYGVIKQIKKLYVKDKQIFAGEFVREDGIVSIPSESYDHDYIIIIV